jgi:2-oxoglutarate ferredoxin oxidoreductase subunit gamma
MSQEAYEKFLDNLIPGGILLTDSDLVKPQRLRNDIRMYSIPSTRIAEEMGNRIFANVVMVGFFTAITKLISDDAVKKALPSSVPERFINLNIEAFERGYQFGIDILRKEPPQILKKTTVRKSKAAT